LPDSEKGGPSGHIVILGAMGSGKSNLGRRLAAGLGREAFDSDVTIEAKTGRRGRDIAESDGVPALHRMEREALLEALAQEQPAVIAAAASVVDDPATRAALEEVFCIWVRADPRVLEERASRGDHRRDVATTEHLERRDPHYAALADLIVDTGISPADETAARALAALVALGE
jgi:shikimate kinase